MSELWIPRRRLLTGLGALAGGALLSGCDGLNRSAAVRAWLERAEKLHYRAQRAISGDALAPEYRPDQRSPFFRTNGSVMPRSPDYAGHLADGFAHWRLAVDGLVRRPLALSLGQLQAMPAREQITRHDCVEGWSAIGQWAGPPLKLLLDAAGLMPAARFIVFHCADDLGDVAAPYYESIDLDDAFHPQTILALRMNGAPLAVGHGAPVRLRVERQLGYKQAKFVMRIEARARLDDLYGGKGGLWEDRADYAWYAGI